MSLRIQVHILTATDNREKSVSDPSPLIVVEAGCKSGDKILGQSRAVEEWMKPSNWGESVGMWRGDTMSLCR